MKPKTTHEKLLERIRQRKVKGLRFGQGIWTADKYVSSVTECVGPGVCSRYFGDSGKMPIAQIIKEASQKLTFAGDNLLIEEKAANIKEMEALFGAELPKHTMLAFRHVLTTPREDRDTDILETEGARPDPKMPLLWQHIHTLPIGKAIRVVEHTKDVLRMASVLLDINDLTSDAAKLIEANALRFSHGFRALEFSDRAAELGGSGGFRIKLYEIMEESLVSVPSNVDAEVELWSAGKLKSQPFKSHAKAIYESTKKTQVRGVTFRESLGDYSREITVGSFAELKKAADAGLIAGNTLGEDSLDDAGANANAPSSAAASPAAVKTPCACQGKSHKEMSDGTEQFDNEIDAITRAGTLGCIGTHKVGDKFCPCSSPEVLAQMVAAGQDVKGKKDIADQTDSFDTPLEADTRAETLGCLGHHQVGGKYIPCASAEEYEKFRPKPQPSLASAKPAEKTYIDGSQLAGSYTWRMQKLQEKLLAFLVANAACGPSDNAWIVALYDNYAIVSVCENARYDMPMAAGSDDDDYYRITWAMRDGDVFWIGIPQEVRVEQTTEIVAAASAEFEAKRALVLAKSSKAGRVLSARNVERLQSVIDDLVEMQTVSQLSRSASAVAERAVRTLQEILASAKPTSEGGGSDTSGARPTDKQAAQILLASEDRELLECVGKAIAALKEVHQLDRSGELYRKLSKMRR